MVVYCDWCKRVPVNYPGQVCSPKCREEIEAAQRNHRAQHENAKARAEAREAAAQLHDAQLQKANAEALLAETTAAAVRHKALTEAAARQTEAAAKVKLSHQAAQAEERRRQEAHYVALGTSGRNALAQKAKSDMDRVAIMAIFDILGDADSLIDQVERLPSLDSLSDQTLKQTADKMTALRPKLIDKRTEMGAIQYWAAGKDRKAALNAYQAALDCMDQWGVKIQAALDQRNAARKVAGQQAATLLNQYNEVLRFKAQHLWATTTVQQWKSTVKFEDKDYAAQDKMLQEHITKLNNISFFERMWSKKDSYNYLQKCIPDQQDAINKKQRICEQAKQQLSEAEAQVTQIVSPLSDQQQHALFDATQQSILFALNLDHASEDQRTAVLGAILGIACGAGTWTPWGPAPKSLMHASRTPKVTLTRPFTLGAVTVPQILWERVMGTQPSHFKGELLPVEGVTWYEAVRFCNKLSERLGLSPVYQIRGEKQLEVLWDHNATGFRLPTEAEWGWAEYRSSEEHPADAGWNKKTASQPHSVGLTKPNLWGFYDLYGNVDEWCWDVGDPLPTKDSVDPIGPRIEGGRVLKGGCCADKPFAERRFFRPDVTNRGPHLTQQDPHFLGLRIARTL